MARGRAVGDYKDYEHHEDNVDPAFRPGLGKLVHKLREISILTDRPDSVEHLISDLSYQHLVHPRKGDKSNPEALWRVINKLMRQYLDLAGGRKLLEGLPFERGSNIALEPVVEAPVSDLGGAPVIRYTPHNWDVNFRDDELKAAIATIIRNHASQTVHVDGDILCRCSKTFEGPHNWADHVRKRIWKEMKQE